MLAPLRPCPVPRCPALTRNGRCDAHKRTQERERYNVDVRKLYRTARWRQLRARKFAENPLCDDCQAEGRAVPWTELDHTIPHRGDLTLFWDEGNLRGKCKTHHSMKTGRGE